MFSFLKSVKLAIVLIALLTALIVAGMVIPQADLKPALYAQWRASHPGVAVVVERLSLDHTFTSWWFLVVVGLFFVNTLACTVDQAVKTWRLARQTGGALRRQKTAQIEGEPEWLEKTPGRLEQRFTTGISTEHLEKMVALVLRGCHYVVHESIAGGRTVQENADLTEPEGEQAGQRTRLILAEKNRAGYWGSVIFHAGLLLIILGVGYGSLGGFEGVMLVAEGERRTEGHGEYIYLEEGPAFAEAHPGFMVGLEKIRHFPSTKKTPGGMTSSLTLDGKPFQLEQRTPLVYRGFRIYQDRFGDAVSLEIDTGRGAPLQLTAGLLDQITIDGSKVSKGSLVIPGTAVRARLTLYADATLKDGRSFVSSLVLKRPLLRVILEDGTGARLFQGDMKVGQGIHAAGLKLTFTGASYWLALRIRRDPGQGMIFAGFAVGLLGLILLYFLIPRKVWVEIKADPGPDCPDGWQLSVRGSTPRHSDLLEAELEEIRRALVGVGRGKLPFTAKGGHRA